MKLIINVVNWFRNIDQKGSYGPHTGIMDSIPHENIHEVDKKCGVFVKNFFSKEVYMDLVWYTAWVSREVDNTCGGLVK